MTFGVRIRRDPGSALVALAVAIVIVLYAATLGRGLVNYDDLSLYRDNWILQRPSWDSLRIVWFDLDGPNRITLSPEYLPIRDTSVMIDFAIWGDWWGGFHLTNLLVYLAAVVLWFKALVAFGVERTTAGLAVLVWAIHPSHAESVAWLAERKGLLGAMFAGASAFGYARFRAGGSARWLVVAAIAAICAVWSKALAAFAIAALAGLEVFLPANRASWRRSLAGLGTLAIVGGLAFIPVLYLATDAKVVGTDVAAPAGRFEMVLGVLGFYVRMGALAVRNAIAYPLSTHGPSIGDVVLGGVAVITLVAIVLPRERFVAPPEVRAGAALWLFTWLPASHLVLPLQMVFVADRYMLMPTLGLALTMATAICNTTMIRTRAKQLLVAAIVLASVLRTLDAQANWRDDLTLWERAIDSNPDSGDAWSMYVQALEDAGAADAALAALEQGLSRASSPRLVMRNANMLIARGDRAAGFSAMREAAEANEPRAMANLALLLEQDGKRDEALDWARRAAGVPLAHVHRVHGKIALAAGLAAEALEAFTAAYELEPHGAQNQYNLALALIAARRAGDALPYLVRCAKAPETASVCRAQLANYERR